MIDTMMGTKVVGGLCGALLFFLLVNWASEGLYHVGGEGQGVVEMVAAELQTEAETDAPEVDINELIAVADMAKGEKVFVKCKACHKLEQGEHTVGPSLFQIVGRAVGVSEGFAYSRPMTELGGEWTVESLNAFMENPRKFLPGTKMSFAGLKKDKDRANILAYFLALQ
ncbi:MAG: cytochrome c family protein [Rhodobacteraceae bacterium]|nr:cytochrome c family protein [Paracoccaceae bacterium]